MLPEKRASSAPGYTVRTENIMLAEKRTSYFRLHGAHRKHHVS